MRPYREADHHLIHHLHPEIAGKGFEIGNYAVAAAVEFSVASGRFVDEADQIVAEIGLRLDVARQLERPVVGADDDHLPLVKPLQGRSAQCLPDQNPGQDGHGAVDPPEHQEEFAAVQVEVAIAPDHEQGGRPQGGRFQDIDDLGTEGGEAPRGIQQGSGEKGSPEKHGGEGEPHRLDTDLHGKEVVDAYRPDRPPAHHGCHQEADHPVEQVKDL